MRGIWTAPARSALDMMLRAFIHWPKEEHLAVVVYSRKQAPSAVAAVAAETSRRVHLVTPVLLVRVLAAAAPAGVRLLLDTL